MSVLEEVSCYLVVECDVLTLHDSVIEDDSCDEDRCEDRSDDTDDEGSREALYRTLTEYEEYDTGEEGSDLTVDDCRISIAVTVSDCLAQTLACTKLFLDTLVDDYVCVNGHTESEDETGDTRECEHCSE